MSSRRNITKIAFDLPKHSQPRDEIVEKRLQHQHLPPIAIVGSNSIVVGNLPLNFSWNSKAIGEDRDYRRSADQIMKDLRPPKSSKADDQGLKPPLELPLLE